MKTATLVKDNLSWAKGHAALYRLSEPMTSFKGVQTDFVVVSSVCAMFSGPETFIFAADENGEVTDWGEMDGSTRGMYGHAEALEDAGYTVKVEA
jgi:hypothetical protein